MTTLCGKFQFDISVAHPEENAHQIVGLKLEVNNQSWSPIWKVSCTPLVNRTTGKDEENFFQRKEKRIVSVIP